jgi:hypothetical protein
MNLIKKLKSDSIIAAALMILFLFANIHAVRQLMRYGTELFFYDKLNVAYQIGGEAGFNKELERVLVLSKMPREVALARSFQKSLVNLAAPEKYVQDKVDDLGKKVALYRFLRNVAFFLILGLLLLRWAISRRVKFSQ